MRIYGGLDNGGLVAPRNSLTPPFVDLRFNREGVESFALRNSIVFRQAEAGKAGEEPVNWWIVGGALVGAAVVIRHENKKDNATTTATPAAATTTPPACFTAQTRVVMADGSFKPISEIELGDEVQSWNFESGRIAANRVSRLHRFDADRFLRINGLEVTGKHPFAIGENVWAEAEDLCAGDRLVGRDPAERIEIARLAPFGQASMGYYVVNERLRVSPVHQLAVNGSWKSAPQLQPGDWLTDIGAERVPVTSVRYVEEKADRYNLVLGRNPRLLYAVEGLMVWNGR